MENKPRKRFGRFSWLWLFTAILASQIGLLPVMGQSLSLVWISLLIDVPLFMLGAYLHKKSMEADHQNGIPITPFGNLLLPWPKPAIGLACLALIELVIVIPFFAFVFSPCSEMDIIRKINGCVGHIPHNSTVISVAFSKDGKTFATSEFEGSVQIWSYPDLTLLKNLGNGWFFGTEMSFSSNGEMLAICSYKGSTSILESKTGNVLHTLIQKNNKGCDVLFTPDDKKVISVSEFGLQIWDVSTGKPTTLSAQDGWEYLDMTPDGEFLAVGNPGGLINIWDMSTSTIISTIQESYLQSLVFSQDGKSLLTVGLDFESITNETKIDTSVVNVWDITSGTIERTITLRNFWAKNIASARNSNAFIVGANSCFPNRSLLFGKPCAYVGQITDERYPLNLPLPYDANSMGFSPIDDKIFIGVYNDVFIWQISNGSD